jgi:hypothetical protein
MCHPPGLERSENDHYPGRCKPARMAQIRRDPASEVVSVSPRRDPPPLRFGAALSCFVSRLEIGRDVGLAKSGFRPTGSFAHSPVRPFAVSPILPCYLQIRPRSQVAGGRIIAFNPHLFQEPFALDFLT